MKLLEILEKERAAKAAAEAVAKAEQAERDAAAAAFEAADPSPYLVRRHSREPDPVPECRGLPWEQCTLRARLQRLISAGLGEWLLGIPDSASDDYDVASECWDDGQELPPLGSLRSWVSALELRAQEQPGLGYVVSVGDLWIAMYDMCHGDSPLVCSIHASEADALAELG